MSCGNVTSHENATFHGNSIACLMEIIFMAKFGILHAKYLVLPYVHVHMCRNEVIIEWYCTYKAFAIAILTA